MLRGTSTVFVPAARTLLTPTHPMSGMITQNPGQFRALQRANTRARFSDRRVLTHTSRDIQIFFGGRGKAQGHASPKSSNQRATDRGSARSVRSAGRIQRAPTAQNSGRWHGRSGPPAPAPCGPQKRNRPGLSPVGRVRRALIIQHRRSASPAIDAMSGRTRRVISIRVQRTSGSR